MSHTTIAVEPQEDRQCAAGEPSSEPQIRYATGDLTATLGTLVKAKVLNMSLTGAGVETSQYLEIGRTYPCRFDGPAEALSLRATVVWSRLVKTLSMGKGEVLPVFNAGLKFSSHLSAREENELAGLLSEYPAILRPGPDNRRGAGGAERAARAAKD